MRAWTSVPASSCGLHVFHRTTSRVAVYGLGRIGVGCRGGVLTRKDSIERGRVSVCASVPKLLAMIAAGTCAAMAATVAAQDHGVAMSAEFVTLAAASSATVEHGGTPATASLLEIGASRPGRVDNSSDVDMFRLDLVGRAQIEVRTSGQTDTRGELLDSTGARLVSDDDDGPGDNFRLIAELDPGVYYVGVRGQPGDYAINARLGGARDHGGTVESSTLLRLWSPADLAAVSPDALLATAGRIHPSTDDTDVFRLDVLDDSMRVTIRTSGSVDTYASLVDSSQNEIAFDDGDGNFRIEQTLDRGIYYVIVNGWGAGAYRVLAVGDVDSGRGSGGGDGGDGGEPTAPPAPTVSATSPTELEVSWDWRFRPNERFSFDFSLREKGDPAWASVCISGNNPSSTAVDDTLTATLTATNGIRADTTYQSRYRYRNVASCSDPVDPDQLWSAIGEGSTPPEDDGGRQAPDLVVDSASVDDDTVDAGASFTLRATVRNRGDGRSPATILRYYRSTNATISSTDAEVGTDSVTALGAGATSRETISLTAPSSGGTYYYGACVDSVDGESRTSNNCSDGIQVVVSDDGGGGADSYCREDGVVQPGERCDIYSTSFWFEVSESRGCLRAGGISICSGNRIRQSGSLNGIQVTFHADRSSDGSWTIDDVDPEPDD